MKIKKHCQWLYFFISIVAGLLSVVNTRSVQAQASEHRVLKVVFTELEGMSETDEYGGHTGLLIDYLNEIAKYTGWDYEYIESNNDDIIADFLEGKYDLMGGTLYSAGFEEYFAYPKYSMGRSRAVLLCRRDDDSLLGYNLNSLNGKTIGVYENAKDKIRYLKEFLQNNELQCELKNYTYEEVNEDGNLYEKLRNGEVDMLLGNDLEIGGEFRMVTSFQAQPYYIVTTVGNTEIVNELNTALEYILESTPDFAEEAYYSNYPDVKKADIQLNDNELRYISEKKNISVAVTKSWHPFYCENNPKEPHEGMLPDTLKEISAFTGLKFSYVYGDNYADCMKLVQDGKADVMGVYLDGVENAADAGLSLSRSYLNLNNIILKHKSVSRVKDGQVCGIMTGRILPSSFKASKVVSYHTVSQLLEAVNKGEVDYIYGVSSMLEQELQNHRYLNVAPVTRESDSVDVCFAVPRPAAPELLTIFNKAIGNIRTADREAIVNRNLITVGYTGVSLKELIYANPLLCILILSGVLILITLVILLITRNRMVNAVMKSRVEAAEAKSMAKSVFLSKMSHEIRTPMNAIVGLTDLTRMEQNVPPEVEKKLEKIQNSSQYLLSLINDILDMSRIENEKMELEEKGFSLSVMLKELKGMMSGQAEQSGLQFVNENHIEHDWVTGDSVRLRQVLTNLLSNAVKFTPRGGEVRLKVDEISCGGETAQYRFSVQDTGMGISPQDQERIFTSFEQIKPGASRSAGVGLGLAISRNIVRLMGGDIEVKSVPGKGTEFFMTLSFPLYSQVSVCEDKAVKDEYTFSGVKILLAEDNDLNAEIAQELLATQGIESSRASNGQEAVEIFLSAAPGEFHAILMDIQMPVKNGYEAAREIRASGRIDARIPIIAMTANTFREDKAEAREAGMDGFVAKPVNPEILFSELQNILQKTDSRN